MSGNLAKVSKKSGERAQSQEKVGQFVSQGNLIVAAQQNASNQTVHRSSYNLPVLYLYGNLFFIRDVQF